VSNKLVKLIEVKFVLFTFFVNNNFINCNSNYDSLLFELDIYFSTLDNARTSIIATTTIKLYIAFSIFYSYVTIITNVLFTSIATILAFNLLTIDALTKISTSI